MKALSIKQPWAWAIIHAGKDVENRSWYTNHRGPFLIHASKTFDREGYLWILENSPKLFKSETIIPGPKKFETGGIVGKAVLKKLVRSLDYSPWMFGPWGFVVKNAEPLPFRPCRGHLGFFDVEYPK